MKKVLLMSLLLAGSLTIASAQSATGAREVGVRFDGINFGGSNAFSLVLKKQKTEQRWNRWRAVFGYLSANNSDAYYNTQLSAGAFFGIEKRKPLAGRFIFNHGWEFGVNGSGAFGEFDPTWSASVSAGYVLGIQYQPNAHFFINLETIPGAGVRLASAPRDNPDELALGANLGFNSTAALTLGVRF